MPNISKAQNTRKCKESTPLKSGQSSDSSELSGQDETDKGRVQLKREIGLVRGVALIVCSMIGSGIFIAPKGILAGTNSVGMSLVVWFVCAVVSALGAMCYAELGTVVPKSGGSYQYILPAYGDLAGFLVCWAMTVILSPCSCALVAITLGTYLTDFLIPGDCPVHREIVNLFAIGALMIIVFINCWSTRWTSGLVVVFASGKVTALVIIIVTGLVKLCQGETQYLDPSVSFEGTSANILGYGNALYYGLWTYGGWENLNTVAEELIDPARNIPLAIGIALPIVTVIYLLTNIAYFTVLSPAELLASNAVAESFAERTLGVMAWLIPLGVCISTFGNLLGHILTSPRLTFAAGREGHMLSILSMVNVKRLTPLPAVVTQGIIGIIFILIGDFDSIIIVSNFVVWIFHGATFVSLLVLRRKYPDTPRPFQVNFLIPILATIVSMFLVLAPVISSPSLEYLYALVLLAPGLVVYLVFVWGKWQLPFMDHLTLFLQKLLLVSPSSDDIS